MARRLASALDASDLLCGETTSCCSRGQSRGKSRGLVSFLGLDDLSGMTVPESGALGQQQAEMLGMKQAEEGTVAKKASESSMGSLNEPFFEKVRDSLRVKPVVNLPEGELGGTAAQGLAGSATEWGRSVIFHNARIRDGAIGIQKQAAAAKGVADAVSVQLQYLAYHPGLREAFKYSAPQFM
eukprot:TRINITY_DN16602_c0_g1_i1.p1 TRINITY_DN16602_c0_g1~~TRINITY_DN16602_c0_g1_i1.p1  ORF type:complete len:183 (-),score=25.14 TRINITY_DN16602_c0_g1_i1:177-725(-)